MASISNLPNGRRAIQFKGADGKRRSIYLGKVPKRLAEVAKLRVEHLVAAQLTGHTVDADTAAWVQRLESVMADKFASAGLIPKREVSTLAPFLNAYIDGRTDVSARTRNNLQQARNYLIAFFGAGKALRAITPGDADDCRRFMLTKLGDNTVRRHCGRAKQFFRAALRKRLIDVNPFGDMRGTTVQANRAREHFVPIGDIHKVLDACPDDQWRLLVALARFAGLRTPSEAMELRWADIDWQRNRFVVRSPKTAHHVGHEFRVVPIFPELLPYLSASFDLAPDGTEFVISRYRSTDMNLRTHLLRIIRRAGLPPWPKPFQNLRASRAIELAAVYPAYVAAALLGHSPLVAQKHYWRVTDADLEKASKTETLISPDQIMQNAVEEA